MDILKIISRRYDALLKLLSDVDYCDDAEQKLYNVMRVSWALYSVNLASKVDIRSFSVRRSNFREFQKHLEKCEIGSIA